MRSLSVQVFAVFLLLFCSLRAAQAQVVPDSAGKAKENPQSTIDEQKILSEIKAYTRRKSAFSRLLGSVFVYNPKPLTVGGEKLVDNSYPEYNFKIVRDIHIGRYDAFGYNINDTVRTPESWLEKTGNSLHLRTDRGRIRSLLLFRRNRPLRPFAITDTERLLRQTDFILDARVIPVATSSPDSVDVLVITKDVWSLSVAGAYSPSNNSGRIAVRDVNFLGLGHRFYGTYSYGGSQPQSREYYFNYLFENISNTFITSELNYQDTYFLKRKGFSAVRDFYTPSTKYAAGAHLDWLQQRFLLPDTGVIRFSVQDFWASRALALPFYDRKAAQRVRLILSGRVINTNFEARPQEFQENFPSSTLYLTSLAYSYRNYYRAHYVFGFGRTEDIPTGHLFAVTGGYERGEFKNRLYGGLKSTSAWYSNRWGYIFGEAEAGSFNDGKRWEQAVFSGELLYFTRLYSFNRWGVRQFLNNRFTYGYQRRPSELLDINKANGIRGFSSGTLRGTRRFVTNIETNVFTPASFFGFRMAMVAFADLAWIGYGRGLLFDSAPFQAYGLGLRFRNEYLIFPTIQLLAAIYPNPPSEEAAQFRFLHSQRPFYEFNDFRFTRPFVAPY